MNEKDRWLDIINNTPCLSERFVVALRSSVWFDGLAGMKIKIKNGCALYENEARVRLK